jgi:hypothetical protein
VGGTDHALYVLDVTSSAGIKRKRTLYNKTVGHTEWVTSCTYLLNGALTI